MTEDWWIFSKKALQSGDWKRALRRLLQCDPVSMRQLEYMKLLSCCYIQANCWKEVANISASAAQRFPFEVIFWECWAWSEYMQGETASAIRILEPMTGRFHERENLVYMLACFHASLQQVPDAQRYLARAEQLSSDPAAFALKASRQKEFVGLRKLDEIAFAG